jgi:hypothetical protein
VTLQEAAEIIREITHARPAQGTLLYRCAEAISMLLTEIDRLERELENAWESED